MDCMTASDVNRTQERPPGRAPDSNEQSMASSSYPTAVILFKNDRQSTDHSPDYKCELDIGSRDVRHKVQSASCRRGQIAPERQQILESRVQDIHAEVAGRAETVDQDGSVIEF
jgi:hypothetical protein